MFAVYQDFGAERQRVLVARHVGVNALASAAAQAEQRHMVTNAKRTFVTDEARRRIAVENSKELVWTRE